MPREGTGRGAGAFSAARLSSARNPRTIAVPPPIVTYGYGHHESWRIHPPPGAEPGPGVLAFLGARRFATPPPGPTGPARPRAAALPRAARSVPGRYRAPS